MKTLNFLSFVLLLSTSLFFSACSDDDDNDPKKGGGDDVIEDVHYDIWVGLDQGKMGRFGTMLVKNVNSLEEQTTVNFVGEGCDVTSILGDTDGNIIKGKYYYQVDAVNKDRFAKYQILNNQITRIAAQPFVKNTFLDRRYTHAWINDDVLVIMAANGDANEVIWTKLNANTLEVISEGNLGLAAKTGISKFSTSGLARYRKSDNTIIYAFTDNAKNAEAAFYVAFINADDMTVKSYVKETRAEEMAGTSFGELRQHKMFFDENENLYIACNSEISGAENSTCQFGSILRIKNGEKKFDSGYQGYKDKKGKIVTVDYMADNKALLYIQDPEHTGTSTDNAKYEGWGDKYNCYYATLDLTTDALTEFKYDGKVLPFCSGTFSQRSFVHNGKAFIGVNPKDSQPLIYVYDLKSGKMEKGLSIQEGYVFTRIVYINN